MDDKKSFSHYIHYAVAERIKRNPYLMYATWRLLPYFPFLLPHEKDYWGLKHFSLPEDGLLLDIGANSGLSALGFRAIGVICKIVSIEANRYHEPSLQRMKRRIANFDYHILAAGDTEMELTLYTPVYKGIPLHVLTSTQLEYATYTVARDYSPRVAAKMAYVTQSVKSVRLDSLELNPDFIKLDVEGFDYQVLLGLQATVARCRPLLLLEYTPTRIEEVERYLCEAGYILFIYDYKVDRFSLFDRECTESVWRSSGLQVNIFCVPSERRGMLSSVTFTPSR